MNSTAGKTVPEDFAVRLGQDEICFILNLKETLEQSEQLVSHAARYRELGWQLLGVAATNSTDLGLDLSQPEESLFEQISALQQSGIQINLGLSTSRPSRLLVVEIHNPKGFTALDQWGDWRSRCWAHTEDGREQHYYYLPPGFSGPRTIFLPESEIMVYGEGGLVLAPPSTALESQAVWRWFAPPWENPPTVPGRAIWQFLKAAQVLPEQPDPRALAELPTWEEIYPRLEPFNEIIRALVAPAHSFEQYYERILEVALEFLIADSTLMLGLLWHAPRGDLRECPQRWLYLQNLAASVSTRGFGLPASELSDPVRGAHPVLTAFPECRKMLPARPMAKPAPPGGPVFEQTVGQALGHSIPEAARSSPENAVVLERGRYEAMLLEMAELSNKAALLERRLAEQEVRLATLAAAPPAKPDQEEESRPEPSPEKVLRPEKPQDRNSGGQGVLREFLAENPDLADQERVQMLQFYLKNYVDINPENHGLPVKDRLAMAAKMVRDFLGL